MKIYLASSWRNKEQQKVIKRLRSENFNVYDFKNPNEKDKGFHWSEIDSNYKKWKPTEFISSLSSIPAQRGFNNDYKAMKECDVCVLLLPCGRSAHLEAGYFVGCKNKKLLILLDNTYEPELMYKMADFVTHKLEGIIYYLHFLE